MYARLEDWRYGSNARRAQENPRFFLENTHVWRAESGRLVAFAICEYGNECVYLQVHPLHRAVETHIVDWIETVWAGKRSIIEIEALAHDSMRQSLLQARGYAIIGCGGFLRRYDLSSQRSPLPLPEGYRIESLSENHAYDAHVEAVREAFQRSTLDRAWLESKLRAPSYRMDFDLAVVAPDGRHASFCLAWPDPRNRIAEIDPIGTHPAFQRRGFAKAIITECFRRLANEGIWFAYIGSAPDPNPSNRLYESLEPVETYEHRRWAKQLG